tara:strand:+ start:518 stop:682 length:165 start_codon:yes stop_codon:yes gene_type:complete
MQNIPTYTLEQIRDMEKEVKELTRRARTRRFYNARKARELRAIIKSAYAEHLGI